jgi:uncharacterized protein (DUF1778 family)
VNVLEIEMPAASVRTSRLEARIATDVLSLVKRAAAVQGRSLTDFVVDSVRLSAETALERHHVLRVSASDYDQIMQSLSRPAAPNPGLDYAMAAHDELISEGR